MSSLPSLSRCSTRVPTADSCGWRQALVVTSTDIIPFLDELACELAQAGWSDADAFAIRLSLEEAIVNAIKHGHQHDAGKQVRIRSRLQDDSFLAEVEDEGPGFDPHDLPDPTEPENLCRPSGRGVFLMRHYMTWVRFNEQGNCVTLCKYRTVV